MSHQIEERNGRSQMAFVGETPWHGLGQKLDDMNNIGEAMAAAGLDWDVELVPLVTEDDSEDVPARAVRRVDDHRIFGVVGLQYRSLQNRSAFAWFQPFLDNRQADIHTAGALFGGKKVWVLAELKRDPLVIRKDDVVKKFVLLSNSHDGTTAIRVGFTPVRVVCWNTLSLAVHDKASKLIRVRHTSNLEENLENIRDVMDCAEAEFRATAEQYRRLANRDINAKDLAKYVRQVFGLPVDKPMNGQQKRLFEGCFRLFEEGRGHEVAGRTLWGAFNSVTELLNYERGASQDSRLTSLWFGEGANINKRALDVALGMAV